MTVDATTARALAIDPEQVRETAADARALAIEDLVVATSPGAAAERLGVTPQVVTKARARVRAIRGARDRKARLARADEFVRRYEL